MKQERWQKCMCECTFLPSTIYILYTYYVCMYIVCMYKRVGCLYEVFFIFLNQQSFPVNFFNQLSKSEFDYL